VTTWKEPECDKLIMASINKNYVDMDEYPVTTKTPEPMCEHYCTSVQCTVRRDGDSRRSRDRWIIGGHNVGRFGLQAEMAEQA